MKLPTNGKTGDQMEAGSLSVPGWFRAVVEEACMDPKHPEKQMLFRFRVSQGPHKGDKVQQTLVLPDMAGDEEKGRKAAERLCAWAKRLGLWDGQTQDPDVEWDDCISKEVVIEAEPNSWTKDDGTVANNVRLKYLGVYPLDHAKIPAEVRQRLGLPPAAAEEAQASRPSQRPAYAAASNGAGARRLDIESL